MWADQPPKLWVPPAIIRPAERAHILVPPMLFRLASAAAAAAAVYVSSAQNYNAGGASQSFGPISFGTPSADRYIVCVVNFYGTNNPTGVTIGGVAATALVTQNVGTNSRQSIWIAAVPSGTTGNVSIAGGVNQSFAVDLYAVTGLQSTVARDSTGVSQLNTQNYSNTDVSVLAGGVIIACRAVGGPACNYSWTAGTVLEDVDRDSGTAAITRSCASKAFAAAVDPVTISVSASVAPTQGGSYIAVALR